MPWVYVGPLKSTCMWGKPPCLWRGTKDHVFLTFWKHHLVSDIKSGYLKRGSIINEAFLRIFPEHVKINSLYRCIVTTCRIAIFGLVVDITTQLFIAKVWTTQLFIRVWIDPNQINFTELMHSQVFKEQYWRASNSKLVIFSQLSPESSSGIWHFIKCPGYWGDPAFLPYNVGWDWRKVAQISQPRRVHSLQQSFMCSFLTHVVNG